MPTYEYDCAGCGAFDALRPMSERHCAAACPSCGGDGARVIRSAPLLSSLAGAARTAHATNERAAHEPKHTSVHGPGCCCCKVVKLPRSDAAQTAPRSPGGRPWMISH
jgi:putative FmdB family regulatory protein